MQITLEGHPQPVRVRNGETLLQALQRAGVAFPYSCDAGTCGTCRCVLVSGRVVALPHSEHALAPADAARGIILACRARPDGNAVIRKLRTDEFASR